MHLSKPKGYTPKVNPSVNYGHWVIIMYQYRFINCNKCTILVSGVDNGAGAACVGAGSREYIGNLCTFLSILLQT